MNIRSIEPVGISLPMAAPMKMAGVEIRTADNVLVRLETDAGVIGWGEAASAPTMTGEFVEGIVRAVRYLAPWLIGQPVAAIDDALSAMDQALYVNASAKAAIEMALYDALGHARGVPVHALLGGARRNRIPALRMLSSGNAERDCADAARLQAEGFVAWKIKVGVNDPVYDAERTCRICEVLGQGHLISADANQGWSVEQAIEYLRRVDGYRLTFLEQPVDGGDIEGMARIARSTRIAIGADEGLHTLEDIRRHHDKGAIRGGSLKTIKLGGLTRVMQAARLCDALGLEVNLACKIAESSIATAAVLHLAAAVPSVNWGISLSSQYLAEDVVRVPPPLVAGHASVPTGPGLGIEVDEARVRRFAL
jgi:o-succinylbenzoate synthase